jgi:hypothetical protein
MENVLLRKLTLKSKVSGLSIKYPNKTVAEVMEIHPSTIWSIYCRFEKITFTDDILETLEVMFDSFKKIPKPGIDKNQINNTASMVVYAQMSYQSLLKLIQHKKINKIDIPSDLYTAFNRAKHSRIAKKNKPEVYTKSSLLAQNRRVK